jgi:peptide/nickel transport system permease protein
MLRYLASRLLQTAPVLVGVTLVVFLSVYLVPGDIAQTLLGFQAGRDAVEALRHQLGLDQPILIQYGHWLLDALKGDLGTSIYRRTPVASLLLPKVLNSLLLMAASLLVVVIFGLLISTASATRFRSRLDQAINVFTLVLASLPPFWLGIVLLYLFGVRWRIFPVSGMYNMANPDGSLQVLYHAILPTLTTAAAPLAMVSRVTRSALVDVLEQPFILAAAARGLRQRQVVYIHAVRNVLPTFAGIVGLQIGYLFGGAIFSEVVFNWPGIGLLLYQSILQRDAPMIQGCTLVIAVVFVLANLAADVAVRALDATKR